MKKKKLLKKIEVLEKEVEELKSKTPLIIVNPAPTYYPRTPYGTGPFWKIDYPEVARRYSPITGNLVEFNKDGFTIESN